MSPLRRTDAHDDSPPETMRSARLAAPARPVVDEEPETDRLPPASLVETEGDKVVVERSGVVQAVTPRRYAEEPEWIDSSWLVDDPEPLGEIDEIFDDTLADGPITERKPGCPIHDVTGCAECDDRDTEPPPTMRSPESMPSAPRLKVAR